MQLSGPTLEASLASEGYSAAGRAIVTVMHSGREHWGGPWKAHSG